MFKFIKRILGLIIFVVLGITGVMVFGSREKISAHVSSDPDILGTDLDAFLRAQVAV